MTKVDNKKESNLYRKSFSATILFSGVQIYQIIVRLVRSKFVALFIGPAGMGITSLLRSTTDLISASTNLGLRTSGVKTVSAAFADNEEEKMANTVFVLRRLIFLTGLIGSVICALFSPLWSVFSFGNQDYTLSFVLVSVIILIEQLNKGEMVLLQGMRQKKTLAKVSVVAQTIGLFTTVPLYYFYGVKAIVPVFVLSSLITYSITRYFTSRIKLHPVKVSWKETFRIGGDMIKLGFFLSLQFLMATLTTYIIRNFVSTQGGIDEVGLYSAGTNIVSIYINLIFTAIATDYFPRLAATKNNSEMRDAVHSQAEISILLFAPLLVAFIVFIKPIIILLYSDQFLPIEQMMYWSISGTIVQAMGWAVSYTILAKAKPSVFFLNELVATCYFVPLKLIGYAELGLTGFGIATLVGFIIYLFQILIVSKRLFDFSYSFKTWSHFLLLCVPIIMAIVLRMSFNDNLEYVLGTVLLLITGVYVIIRLDKMIDLKSLFLSLKKRIIR